jgi:hypothetical protein
MLRGLFHELNPATRGDQTFDTLLDTTKSKKRNNYFKENGRA